jgi:colanic acid/amylovoran biosynthesis glycosyltransferase
MRLVSQAAPARVAHVIETCFNRTETFVYEQVLAPGPYEAWCLAGRIQNAAEFPFERVRLCEVQWNGHRPWDLVDRALWKVRPGHELPFWRSLREVRPACLHAHFGHTGHRVLPIAREYGLPLVTSFYGRDASSLPREEGWMPRLQRLFVGGDVFLAEGPQMRARLIDLGCPPEKVRIVPLLIDPDRYSWQPRQFHAEDPLRLVFVGRFVPKKGLPVLLKALAVALPTLQTLELVVIGSGSDAVELDVRSLVGELQLAHVVRFTGSLPRSAVLAEMARAHVLIAPSHTGPDGDTEGGAPTILLEAQAAGLPVLSTRHADVPFVSAAPYREFLAAENDVEDLAAKLLAIVQASARWPAMAKEGRAHVERQHGHSARAALLTVYSSLLERGSTQSPGSGPTP